MQCAHIVSRSYHSTRWDIENAIALCQKCHTYYTYHPLEWEQWVNRTIGKEKYEQLKQQALSYSFDSTNYEKRLIELEIVLKSVEN